MHEDPLYRALAEARALGFLGPGPVDAHLDHAAAFLRAWPDADEGRALDLGSGGGVPGLVLAARLGGWQWTLLDVSARRARFLARKVHELGWSGRVAVLQGAAERVAHDATHRAVYDVVTARSFAGPGATAEIGGAFLRVGGVLLVADPPDPDDQRWPGEPLGELGLALVARSEDPSIVALRRVAETPSPVPRETARRRPRF